MDTQNKPTDEDKMIQKLTIHKKMIGWVLGLLEKEEIESERTYGDVTWKFYFIQKMETI